MTIRRAGESAGSRTTRGSHPAPASRWWTAPESCSRASTGWWLRFSRGRLHPPTRDSSRQARRLECWYRSRRPFPVVASEHCRLSRCPAPRFVPAQFPTRERWLRRAPHAWPISELGRCAPWVRQSRWKRQASAMFSLNPPDCSCESLSAPKRFVGLSLRKRRYNPHWPHQILYPICRTSGLYFARSKAVKQR